MTWVEGLPILTGVAYAVAAVAYAHRGEWPWAAMYAGYAFANVGLVWAAASSR